MITCLPIFLLEKFYICYKDGLDGNRDMRSFAGFYFLLRYVLCLTIVLSSHLKFISSPLSIASLILVGAAVLISLMRPYKRIYMTVLDTFLLYILAAIFHLLSTDYTPTKGMLINICYYDHSSYRILGLLHLSCVQKVSKELLSKPLRQMFGTGSNKIRYHLIVRVHVYQSWLDLFQAQVYFKYTIMNYYISHMTL